MYEHSITMQDFSGNLYLREPKFKSGDKVRIYQYFDNITKIFSNSTKDEEKQDYLKYKEKYFENIKECIKKYPPKLVNSFELGNNSKFIWISSYISEHREFFGNSSKKVFVP